MNSASTPLDAESFDYIIVGGGSAGLLLADRLSEDGRTTVCVLEAGGSDFHPFFHIPAGFMKMAFSPAHTWTFAMEPGEAMAGRSLKAIQGKVLGGTSSINGMIHNRGQSADYDDWGQRGNRGWSYAELLPYFKRTEKRVGSGDDFFRGWSGKLVVTDNDWPHPICEAFIAAANGLGLPCSEDYNGESQFGVSYVQRTINRGWRVSATRAFLRPAKHRPNLEVRTRVQATRITFDCRRANGVKYISNGVGPPRTVSARREVILACGALNTPKLLQLSGIGDAEFLQDVGVPPLHHLPSVGKNLKDHYAARIVARVKNVETLNDIARGPRLGLQLLRWLTGRPSILGLSAALVVLHGKSDATLTAPNIRATFAPASFKDGRIGVLDTHPGMTCGFNQNRPESAGSVAIRSSDPLEDPLITPNYLNTELDRRTIVAALKLGRRLLRSPELARYFDIETLPGSNVQSDEQWLDYARRYGNPTNHYVGTCRMGAVQDAATVVDDQLRVHGTEFLRVVDASIMPDIPSANTCAPVYAIAEKAADLIRGLPPLSPIAQDG